MINFKQRSEVLPSALILLSIVLLAGTLIYMIFVPTPSVKGLVAGHNLSRQRIAAQTITDKANIALAQKAVTPKLWTGDPDTVSAGVLAQLTLAAQKRGITIGAFRPQRTQPLAGVTELPYIVQMTGSYPSLYAIMAAMTTPNSKIVLRSVQIASSQAQSAANQASNNVTATLGISTYTPADPAIAPATKGGRHA